jgi:acyl-CoA oxidase
VVTYEGDNTVMAQQCARYLMKLYKRSKKGEQLKGHFSYISDMPQSLKLKCVAMTPSDFANLN